MINLLTSLKVLAIGCELNGDRLKVDCLYLKQPIEKPTNITLYGDDDYKILVAIPPLSTLENFEIELNALI